MDRASRACGIAGLAMLMTCSAFAQSAQTEAEALAEVHALLRAADGAGAAHRLAELIPAHPSSVELRALSIGMIAQNEDRAWELARQLRLAHPRNAWSWYGVATVGATSDITDRVHEGLAALEKMEALAAAPILDAMLLLKSSFLGRLGRQSEMNAQLAPRDDPFALYLKAQAVENTAATNANSTEEAEALYARAIAAAPDDLRIAVSHLHARIAMKAPGALEAARKLVERAPLSSTVHDVYWVAIQRSDLPMEEKKALIAADIAKLLELRPWPESFRRAASMWLRLGDRDREAELNREVVRRFPGTQEAQTAMFRLTFRDRWTPSTDPAALAERRQHVQQFVDYPWHPSTALLGEAWFYLVLASRLESKDDDDELLRGVDGVLAYGVWPPMKTVAATALAESGLRLDTAEKLAREGLRDTLRMNELEKASLENYEENLRTVRGEARAVIGSVLLKQNKLAEAGKELQLAAKDRPLSPEVNFHLGTWQERKGELAAAENTYARGMAHESKSDPKNMNALRALYQRRKGSAAGFEEYAANLRLAGASDEKRAVLATRLIPPKPLAQPFALKDLDGRLVSLEDAKGQVTVVNLWGIWCGPCVAEMPELQALYEKYANDPKVRILTINNDADTAKVAPWMKKNDYTLPVLLGRSWMEVVRTAALPTTYFIEPDGGVAFIKTGRIGNLVEEFSWRIEAMKAN